eukprot:scaffold4168_cov212-Pinguiococcus_pyrenoidosus.AAC.3
MIEEATKKPHARSLAASLAPASLDAARPSLEPASLKFSSVLSLTPSELAEDILNAIQAYSSYFCNLHKFQKGNASACYLAIQFERNPLFQDQFSLCFSGLMNSQPPSNAVSSRLALSDCTLSITMSGIQAEIAEVFNLFKDISEPQGSLTLRSARAEMNGPNRRKLSCGLGRETGTCGMRSARSARR